jgi:hypothetical protein
MGWKPVPDSTEFQPGSNLRVEIRYFALDFTNPDADLVTAAVTGFSDLEVQSNEQSSELLGLGSVFGGNRVSNVLQGVARAHTGAGAIRAQCFSAMAELNNSRAIGVSSIEVSAVQTLTLTPGEQSTPPTDHVPGPVEQTASAVKFASVAVIALVLGFLVFRVT